MREQVDNFLVIMMFIGIIFSFIMAINWMPFSSSGSMQILTEQGEWEDTTIYKNDTLWYTPNDGILSKDEIQALRTMSRHYTIIVNP